MWLWEDVGQYIGSGLYSCWSNPNHNHWSSSAEEEAEVLLNPPWTYNIVQFNVTALFSIHDKCLNNSHSYPMCVFFQFCFCFMYFEILLLADKHLRLFYTLLIHWFLSYCGMSLFILAIFFVKIYIIKLICTAVAATFD